MSDDGGLMIDTPDQIMALAANVRDNMHAADNIPDASGRAVGLSPPPARIEDFGWEIVSEILHAEWLPGDYPAPALDAWLEKIRRYAEINRADLWRISVRRFESPKGAGEALCRMLVVLAAVGASRRNLLLLNACAEVRDCVGSRRGVGESRAEIRFADEILDRLEELIGQHSAGARHE